MSALRHLMATACTAAVVVTVGATSASAADSTVTVTCTESQVVVYGNVGDSITFDFTGDCNENWQMNNAVDYVIGPDGWLGNVSSTERTYYWDPNPWGGSQWYTYFGATGATVVAELLGQNPAGDPLPGAGSVIGQVNNDMLPYVDYPQIVIPIVYGGTAPAPGQPGDTATVIRQALPMPATGSCVDVDDAAYSWGTGLSGGWQRGWEPWAGADGSGGGWACVRALVNRGGVVWELDRNAV